MYLIMSNFFLKTMITASDAEYETLTTLNDTNDLTRLAYQNNSSDIPLRNNSMTDRFESNTFINHKESFEDNNTRLNSLHDEIRELKDKLRIIPEKDNKIHELHCDKNNLESELENIRGSYQECKRNCITLKSENQFLQSKLDKLSEENKELQIISEKETAENPKSELKEDLIPVNIIQIKEILCSRLRSYHEKHIDDLIQSYELHKKTEINKSLMEKILVEAIHINLTV